MSLLSFSQPQLVAWSATAIVTFLTICIVARLTKKNKTIDDAKEEDHHEALQFPPMTNGGFFYTVGKFFSKDMHRWLLDLSRNEGKVVQIPIVPPGHPTWCIVSDPKLARRILEDPTSTKWYTTYAIFDAAFGGKNFFSAEGERYKHTRRNHSVAFGPKYQESMTDIAKAELDKWIDAKFGGGGIEFKKSRWRSLESFSL